MDDSEPKQSEYLFEYEFGGSTWGFSVHAASAEEAQRKASAMAGAALLGELVEAIPAQRGWAPQIVN